MNIVTSKSGGLEGNFLLTYFDMPGCCRDYIVRCTLPHTIAELVSIGSHFRKRTISLDGSHGSMKRQFFIMATIHQAGQPEIDP